MNVSKAEIVTSVSDARRHLDEALAELEQLPAFDPGTIGFAAHALNNYLTVASGAVDLLLAALAGHPDPDVRTWLEALRRGTNMMEHTVNQLMNTSAGANPRLFWEKVNLPLLVQRGCDYYQRVANRKKIRISCDATTEPLYVWSDRVALAAVMDNLLSNAVKYSEPGKQISVGVQSQPDHLVCSVRDEGPGLSEEEQAKLFQRGVRLSAVPTGGEPSTGFGLAVAKEFMGMLGGEIWCESAKGKGSCFSIRLRTDREDMAAGRSGMQGPHLGAAGSGSANRGD
jgi:signal transduction histidine kinase